MIEISEVETLRTTAETMVVRFVECHKADSAPEYRRTTAVLLCDSGEHRYRWLALQETAVAPGTIENPPG